jgi:hypothetical protein
VGRAFALRCCAGALLAAVPVFGHAEAPPVRTLALHSAAEAIDEPLALAFDRRLTIVAPQPIRLAVPGSPDVIGVTVKDRVAVVTLVDSDFVRKERPGTNLTLLLEDASAVALRLTVATRPADVTTDLVHLEQGPEIAATRRAMALKQLQRWAEDEAAAPAEVRKALQPNAARLEARLDERLLQRVARLGGEWLERPGRTQAHFIYVTGDRALRLGDTCWVRFTVGNRSQPMFRIGAVHLRAPALPEDAAAPAWDAPDPEVVADAAPRPVALRLPGELCRAPLTLEVCEAAPGERCVTAELDAP